MKKAYDYDCGHCDIVSNETYTIKLFKDASHYVVIAYNLNKPVHWEGYNTLKQARQAYNKLKKDLIK